MTLAILVFDFYLLTAVMIVMLARLHVGCAIQTISAAEAVATWDLFDEIASVLDHAVA